MKKIRLFEEGMDKVLVGMNLKEANENEVKMDKPKQEIRNNSQKSLKPRKTNDFNQESKTILNPNVIKRFWIIWPSSMNTALIILLA